MAGQHVAERGVGLPLPLAHRVHGLVLEDGRHRPPLFARAHAHRRRRRLMRRTPPPMLAVPSLPPFWPARMSLPSRSLSISPLLQPPPPSTSDPSNTAPV